MGNGITFQLYLLQSHRQSSDQVFLVLNLETNLLLETAHSKGVLGCILTLCIFPVATADYVLSIEDVGMLAAVGTCQYGYKEQKL